MVQAGLNVWTITNMKMQQLWAEGVHFDFPIAEGQTASTVYETL